MMSPQDLDALDADVPELAVRALNAAFERARSAGHELVYVEQGRLVRRLRDGTIIELKTLPSRPIVEVASDAIRQ
jgi:hypothetical protein